MKHFSSVVLILSIVFAVACSPASGPDDATNPPDAAVNAANSRPEPADGVFYPLAIGNIWYYSRTFAIDGEVVSTASIEKELTGYELLFERMYTIEEARYTETSFGETRNITNWVRYRQDRAGLYAADVAVTQPPSNTGGSPAQGRGGPGIVTTEARTQADFIIAKISGDQKSAAWVETLRHNLELHERIRNVLSPPGGSATNEITRLAYPLHRGQTWIIRDDPFFGSTVDQLEVLQTPAGPRPAWRVHIDSELFGPDDEVYLWYNRCGGLGLYARLFSDVVDPDGDVTGTLETVEWELLEGVDLPGRNACDR